jgi:hypothetical protein
VSDCAARILGEGADASSLPENVVCRVPACYEASNEHNDGAAGALCDVTCSLDADCEFLDKADSGSDLPHLCQDGACRTLDEPESPASSAEVMSICPAGRALVPGESTADGFGFCLDVGEVTVNAFGLCVVAGDCTPPDSGNFLTAGRGEHPVQLITLAQAEAYCAYAAARLPTQVEWQAASKTGEALSDYPWGDQSPKVGDSPPNVCGLDLIDTCVAQSFPEGVGPHGHLDLSGNVAELVTTPEGVCAAGGAYDSAADALMTTSCVPFTAADATIGFRCMSAL